MLQHILLPTEKIYDLLPEEGAFCLTTLMYPEHRRRAIAEIKRRLKENLPCRVISTSLIEAGVDLDFPAVFRELAGIDSIIQAAGRCNIKHLIEPSLINCGPILVQRPKDSPVDIPQANLLN